MEAAARGKHSVTIARAILAAAALLSAIAGTLAVVTGRIPFNSDQAVVGLMARHILAGDGHPIFYYGATYAGSLEPHFVAGVFAILGPSVASFRTAMAILLVVLAGGTVLLARRVFGTSGGIAASAYLAFPPFFLLYKGLTSDGAYDTVALAALAEIAIVLAIEKRHTGGRLALYPAFGLVAGLAWWVSPVTLPLSAVCAVWSLWRCRRDRLALALAGLAGGGAIGAAPWWIWNARHAWASLGAPELASAGPLALLWNSAKLLWISLPALEGGVIATPNPAYVREPFPGARLACLAVWALLLGPSLAATIRTRDRTRGLLWSGLIVIFAAAALSGRTIASEPRYLIAYYVLLPLLAAGEMLRPGRRRAAPVLLACLMAFHLAALLSARVNRKIGDFEITGSLDSLVRGLEARGIRTAYANYWTAYRLSFESGERVTATPFPGDELVRYEPYRQQADADPSAAVILLPPRDGCYRRFLEEARIPFSREAMGGFGVYSGLDPRGFASLRAARGLPLPVAAYRVRWDRLPADSVFAAGSSRDADVTVTNVSPCVWPSSVHLSYHWRPKDPKLPPAYDNPRGYFPAAVYPGRTETVPLRITAPALAGEYRIEYDLVHENVDWFSTKGARTVSAEARVTDTGTEAGAAPGR